MARNDGRIEKGQRLSSAISAKAWNRAQQAADVVLGVQPSAVGDGQSYGAAPYQWVYAKNVTGSDLARWGVMAITGVEVTPTSDDTADATKQFQSMPVLRGAVANSSETKFIVALEPIANNAIGRVAISGVVQIRKADKSKAGSAAVLWENADWALIRFGGGGESVRLCKTSSPWLKGTIGTLQIWENGTPPNETESPDTIVAVNKFAQVAANKFVIVAKAANQSWYLIAAEC